MAKKLKNPSAADIIAAHPMSDFMRQTRERMELFRSPAMQMGKEIRTTMDLISAASWANHYDLKPVLGLTPKMLRGMYPLSKAIGTGAISAMNFSSSVTSASAMLERIRRYGIGLADLDFEEDGDDKEVEAESFLLDAMEPERPEGRIILLHEVNRLQLCIEDIHRDHAKLSKLRPREFEEVSAELMRNQGFDVELTKQTRDGGFDLIAVRNLGDIPLRFLVECKRYAMHKPIGVKLVREFSNVIQTNNANKGLLLTTSYFSADAKIYREKFMPYQLDFRDRGDILEWVKAYLNS